MSVDLEQSLTELAQSAGDDLAAERITGQVHQMVSRIRRRRAARHASTGVLGVGAAAAVALGGVQLVSRDASEAPPASNGGPIGTPDALECGATVTDPRPADGGAAELVVNIVTIPAGATPEHQTITVTVTGLTGQDVAASGGPELVIVQGGEVVAPPAVLRWTQESFPPVYEFRQDVTSCSPEALGSPLAAGEYELWATLPSQGDGTQLLGVLPLTVDSTGVDLADDPEITDAQGRGEAEVDAARVEASHRLEVLLNAVPTGVFPACGAAVELDQDPVLTLDLDVFGQPLARGDRVDSAVTVRATAGGQVIANAAGSGARLVIVQEGVVVGLTYQDSEDITVIDVGPDVTATVPLSGGLNLCATPMTDTPQPPLPAGTYDAYAVLDVLLKEVKVAGGEARSVTEAAIAVSEPVRLTVN